MPIPAKYTFDAIDFLQQELAFSQQQLLNNALYDRLQDVAGLRQFMEHHVYAVWARMSLLKALQRDLTCGSGPGYPLINSETFQLVDEMVLEEESDGDIAGRPSSHFKLYLRAMDECHANTWPIRRFVLSLCQGRTLAAALDSAQAPDTVRQFVETMAGIMKSEQPHKMAAAFAFGHADLIPDAFRRRVDELRNEYPGQLDLFAYYLSRHQRPQQADRAPQTRQMVRELCGDDPQRWQDCQEVAITCLGALMALWDGIKPAKAKALALV
jgi:hypothetical protein